MDIEYWTSGYRRPLRGTDTRPGEVFGALLLYIATQRLAEALEHLHNSPLVDAHRYSLNLGLRQRFRAVGDIAGLLAYPDCPVEFGA